MGRHNRKSILLPSKRKMMKNTLKASWLVLVMLLLCSCKPGRASESMELSLCGSYSVPGCFCSDLKGTTTSVEVTERDQYGRILFEYTAVNIVSGEPEMSLVICQQRDADYVYYYEDICYCRDTANEQTITDLKNRNDWNKPLDAQKMSKRENLITYDLCIQTTKDRLFYGKVLESISEFLIIPKASISEVSFQDVSPNGYEMYIISTSVGGTITHYIVFLSSEYDLSLVTEIENIPSAEEIAEMKRTVGW